MIDDPRNALTTKSKIIMGVDDTPENLHFLKRAIEAGGYTFVAATNGHECLTMLGRITPKLLLLDIEMEPIDGFETCRRIRRIAGLEQLPIAFLTARKTAEDVEAGLGAGGNDFIVKPYSIAKLRERVEYWMTHRPRPAAA
ncbi:MAG TPA: response regulator [Stellaceae bacterium]|jgi:DNA-binding response OmpR family regulator|nr:response regulator [Stellaceae bacterium]